MRQFFVLSQVPQQNRQSELTTMLQSRVLPNLIVAGFNMIVAPMLIVGAIGVLLCKRWGLSFLRAALILAMVFIVIRVGVSIYTNLLHMQFSASTISQVSSAPRGPQLGPETTRIVASFHYFYLARMILSFLTLLTVYVSASLYLKSLQVRRYHDTVKKHLNRETPV